MAFVSAAATSQIDFVISGEGTETMASIATSDLSFLMSGNLLKATRLTRAKATSSTRIRVDFSAPVDNNVALVNVANWRLFSYNSAEFQAPTVMSVEIPPAAGIQAAFVVLVVSEMHEGTEYILLPNSVNIEFGAPLMDDSDFETAGSITTYWTPVSGSIQKVGIGGTEMARVSGTFKSANGGRMHAGRPYVLTGQTGSDIGDLPTVTNSANGDIIWTASIGPGNHMVKFAGQSGDSFVFYTPPVTGFIYFNTHAGLGLWDNLVLQTVYGVGDSSVALITSNGAPIAKDAVALLGMGISPKVKMVLATSEIDVTVFFTEVVATDVSLMTVDVSNFTFNNGLDVLSIDEIGSDYIKLRTSSQVEGELYQLTIDGVVISDMSGNKFANPAIVAMIGFLPGAPVEAFQKLQMYMFLLEGIRQEDQDNGNQFVERLFNGPQQLWEATTQQILAVPKIWSLEQTPDVVLPFLKDIVGWTKKLNPITDRMDADTLRRLISVSVPFWKQRGIDDIIEDILRLLTGTRVRVLDWFWYRWILDETQMSEEHDGLDPYLLDTPGEGPDVQTYAVRIVDNGNLDYVVIRNVLKLTRPIGERIEVAYIGFYDRFEVDGDKVQWLDTSGVSAVLNRRFSMTDEAIDEDTKVILEPAIDWADYVVTFRIRGDGSYYMDAYRFDSGDVNAYRLVVAFNGVISLLVLQDGNSALLAQYIAAPGTFDPAAFHSFRIALTVDAPNTNIKVYWDSNLIIEASDGTLSRGTIAVGHASGGTVEVSEVEMFFNPMKTDFIDINS